MSYRSRMRIFRAGLVTFLLSSSAFAQEGNERAARLANTSPTAKRAVRYITETARTIRDPKLKAAVLTLLERPRPSFMDALAAPAAREEVRQKLVAAKLLDPSTRVEALFQPLPPGDAAPQPFIAAPGQAPHGHHSYPGGLAEHTAFNLQSAVDLQRNYERSYQLPHGTIDSDVVIAAPILHDLLKTWVLQWRADGTQTVQAKVAGTASHHPFIVAEAFHRGLSPRLIVALASAHDVALGDSTARAVGFIRAGAILAGVDPVASGVLVQRGDVFELAEPAGIEAAIHHLSDHDYVLTEPATKVTDAAIERLARSQTEIPVPAGATLEWMRHRIQCQLPEVALYNLYSHGGDAAILAELHRRKIPLLTPDDLK